MLQAAVIATMMMTIMMLVELMMVVLVKVITMLVTWRRQLSSQNVSTEVSDRLSKPRPLRYLVLHCVELLASAPCRTPDPV